MDSAHPDGPKKVRTFFSPVRAWLRRFVFFGSVVVVTVALTYWLYDLFDRMSMHRAHFLLLAVFCILTGLLVLGSFHAIFGAWDILLGKKQAVRITKLAEEAGDGPLTQRYAVVMPVYNEDCTRFCARIEAIYRSIEATGHIDSYDFFILSDTRDLDLWVLEEAAWTNLCRKLNAFGKIYYRRRKKNTSRKAGNIGDFVRTWGGGYEGMVVLDADSLMDGGDILKMTRVMEAYPNLGILQTPPKLIRGTSIFTRLQQFAMRLYGPLFIRGLNWWQLGGGSYWGHNALIRLKPFSDFCELPDLPGREPFGGKILSHDFVEAALMVSQGWEVWLAWDIEGTYEEAPPTLIDHLKRDRRWCQGNLQHLWLIFARKLPLTVRAHLFMGIMAYLGSPLWFLFLIFGTWIAWIREESKLSNLPYDGTPIARWLKVGVDTQSLILTGAIFLLLFLPKILALIGSILVPRVRRSFGGFFPLVIGVCIETVLSMLLAPAVMLAHTLMVSGIVLGHAVGWGSQNRDADGTSWGEAFTVHAPPTFLGIAWGLLAWKISPVFAAWMAPITLGLVLSIPVSVLTSRARYGKALGRYSILSTPEELNTPTVMKLADMAQASVDPALDATVAGRHGVIAAVVDPYVNGVHVSLLEPSELTETEEAMVERCLTQGPTGLSKDEMIELMYLAPGMLALHRAVWLRPAEGIHSTWTQAVESYRKRLEAGAAEEMV